LKDFTLDQLGDSEALQFFLDLILDLLSLLGLAKYLKSTFLKTYSNILFSV